LKPASCQETTVLSAGALAVLAPWTAAGSTLAVLQRLLGPANTPFSRPLLLGILDPADELVAGQRADLESATVGIVALIWEAAGGRRAESAH
jgi:hypothetical protein